MPPKPDEDAPRGGTRGGLELFKWDSLKGQSHKEREHYLGYSAKLGNQGVTGNWRKNDWWQKDREKTTSISEEKKIIQNYEKQLFDEALGLKPKNLLLVKSKLSTDQMAELLKTKEIPKTENTKKRKKPEKEEPTGLGGLGFKSDGKATTWAPSSGEEISRNLKK